MHYFTSIEAYINQLRSGNREMILHYSSVYLKEIATAIRMIALR